METEGDAKGRRSESGKEIELSKRIQRSKSAGRKSETTEAIQGEISFLDLIAKNVTKLKAESKLRISYYSNDEIQIHMDNMRSAVTTLLQIMEIPGKELGTEKMGVKAVQIRTDEEGESGTETQAPGNFDIQLKSILEGLKQIRYVLLEKENRSYKDVLESKSISELFKETRDSLAQIKVETEIKARGTDEAPQNFSLDTVKKDKGMDEVSRRISTSGLEIEEAKDISSEAKGRDVVLPRKPTKSELVKAQLELSRKEAMAMIEQSEEEAFDQHRCGWISNWSSFCGTFAETTTLSPMQFTHSTSGDTGYDASVANTLQMYSIKVTEIKDALELKWPLHVYGVVAARDTVDHNRNILFYRQRDDYQELSQKDPFLRLTGPSRAIVINDHVLVEIELKVKGRTKSEDKVLMSEVWCYSDRLCTLYTPLDGRYCTLVLSSEELEESVQATIVGVRVTEGTPWPFKYGGRVACSSLPRKAILPDSKHMNVPSFRQVVLEDGAMAMDSNGYLGLSRQVVSVELGGRLEILLYAYSQSNGTAAQSRGIAAQSSVSIKAQSCMVSRHKRRLDNSTLEITVAWSLLVLDKDYITAEGSFKL